jgi:hypothetical protein
LFGSFSFSRKPKLVAASPNLLIEFSTLDSLTWSNLYRIGFLYSYLRGSSGLKSKPFVFRILVPMVNGLSLPSGIYRLGEIKSATLKMDLLGS